MTIKKTIKIELIDYDDNQNYLGTFNESINYKKVTENFIKNKVLQYDWKYQSNHLSHENFLTLEFRRDKNLNEVELDLKQLVKDLRSILDDTPKPFLVKTNDNIFI